jgi:hypothetical protein
MALQEVNRALKKAAMLLWQDFRSLASVKYASFLTMSRILIMTYKAT